MNQAHHPLQEYLEQLTGLFGQAQRSRNPALFLYRHDARTPLFMAESLLRLLCRIKGGNKSAKGLKTIKKLEDILGQVDYYDDLVEHFSKNRQVKEQQLDYFIFRRDRELEKLNKKLIHKTFFISCFSELSQAFKVNFNTVSFIQKLKKEMQKELKTCLDLYNSYPRQFTNLEGQVHEIRRKLRWLSIYAQSLQGIVVLKPTSKTLSWEKELVPRGSQNTAFNKLVSNQELKGHIFIHQKAFFALNFVVEQLGKIKDKGLALEAFEKMLKKTSPGQKKGFEKMAQAQLKLAYDTKEVMAEAHALLHRFFIKYKIQQLLIR